MSDTELPLDSAEPHAPAGTSSPKAYPIVAIGASAGGLEAISELLAALPAEPGMTILVVQHLKADADSHLSHLLARATAMPVREPVSAEPVRINHVYVIPPHADMTLEDDRILLSSRNPRGPHMPIDYLFRSLAQVYKNRAIGVLLSGGGTDGTLGFKEIKAEGGITFAQDEKSARYTSMPRSAVAEGYVDYVLSPAGIAQELVRLARLAFVAEVENEEGSEPVEDPIKQIISLLRTTTEVDFTHYKRTTIQRRMALCGLERIEDYLARLREHQEELQCLYQDFLIRVTQFFRDPEAYEALKEKALPLLLQTHPSGQPIRVWVSGCATGEEVYSLAITLLEYLGTLATSPGLKILATDLNEAALERARAGVYVDNIEIDVSPERLRRFFNRVDGSYQISKSVRELCVFSRHNLVHDPPFSHLDLVSCRNVMIYLDAALQRRVIPILHYSLNPSGILFLGSSESVGVFTDQFTAVDAKYRIFAKRAVHAPLPLEFTPYVVPEGMMRRAGREEGGPIWSALDVQREADRIVLSRYAPVGVVVDEAMVVLQFRGRTGPYLEPASGMASLDLFRMLREGLLAEVRSALMQAKAENVVVTRKNLRVSDGGLARLVHVEVIPFCIPPSGIRFFLVLFLEPEETRSVAERMAPPAASSGSADQLVGQLQQELSALREYLQSVIEEQESTNEELKSANEEILSANEELQSTNEELQTAKEEAQSANEELATVNEELRHRNAELARLNNDLVNLLSGVNIPIVMVGRDLRIRRFTPLAEKVFNLIPTDMGRPISDIKSNLRVADLVALIVAVIDTLTPHEAEVQDQAGHWFLLRIRPYITLDNKIDGASVVLLDIDSIKRKAAAATAAPPSPG